MAKYFGDKKLICPVCGKKKDQDQFDWLPKQQKYHHDCTACTKKSIMRDRRYLVYYWRRYE